MLENANSAADITMNIPFRHMGYTKHNMTETDRLNKPEVNFPVGMAFGDRDFFSSDQGGEEILNAVKAHNGGRVNLFKMEKGTHAYLCEMPDKTAEYVIGTFEGTITDRWETTTFGDYHWHGEKATKSWKPVKDQRADFDKKK